LLVGTIPLATAASAASLRWAVGQAKAAGVRIALDVNWRPTFWDVSSDPAAGPDAAALNAMQPLIAAASLLKLAKEEALWLFGSADPSAISAGLPQAPDVVVTDGGNPVHWSLGGASGVLEALAPPQVVDTTGAGDAFSSGLLHQLVQGAMPPEQMLRFAAACGALVCGGAGAIDPQPDAAAVQRFLQR
jgi:fructokinase